MSVLPRGVRNNNPGNIDRNATAWQGMAQDQRGDNRFVVFVAPEWGIRAIAKILIRYRREYDLDTVSGLIGRWAPPNENDTSAYIANVCKGLGIGPNDPVDLTESKALTALVDAIIMVECSHYQYPPDIIARGVGLALGTVEA